MYSVQNCIVYLFCSWIGKWAIKLFFLQLTVFTMYYYTFEVERKVEYIWKFYGLSFNRTSTT